MPLSLKESRSVAEMAEVLYNFLPGSGNPKWKGHVSFKTIAKKVGVEDFWQSGSKIPMITSLFENTLEYRRGCFEPLILEIVRAGLLYRQKQGSPIRPEEIDKLNGLILEVGFKFPDLWDPNFKTSLSSTASVRSKENIERTLTEEKIRANKCTRRSIELNEIKNHFYSINDEKDRQKAGFEFEEILNRLFDLHDLAPRAPFKIEGEQIDGSFELDHEIYLVEAKWQQNPSPESDLLVFRGKIEGKSHFTRGVFISINGISKEAAVAINRGKQPTFFVIDGYDVNMLLNDSINLSDFLRKRQRLLAEEGRIIIPFSEL